MKTTVLATVSLAAQIAAILAASAQMAAAQQVSTPGSSQAVPTGQLEEIIVTAERRSQNLSRTPIAATVLTGNALTDRGVTIVDQLQFISPSAVVNNFGQGIDFNIRGIGKAEHNTQTTTGVITYRDGVATFPGYFTAEPYYDINRVEILRGPQGTFVGQNATGGAVFVWSNDPVINGGNHGYIEGLVGDYSAYGVQGALNLPVSDKTAARISFNSGWRDSFYDITGPYTGDDGVETLSFRLGVLSKPNDKLTVNFKIDLNYLDLSSYPADPVNAPDDEFDITANAELKGRDRFGRGVLKIDYEFDNGIVLRSVSGYQEGTTEYRTDLDGTSVGNAIFGDKVDETIFSQELNLISPDAGPFKWVVGAYYQDDEYDFPPGEFYIGLPNGTYLLEGTNPKETQAVFGQVSYAISSGLELALGARYSDNSTENHIKVNQYGLPIVQEQRETFTNLSGKASLNWTVNETNFVYGFVATGYRPGGLNVPVGLGEPDAFDEEEVTTYEIGWKADWADNHVRTQFNAYYSEYDGFQVTVGYPTIPVFGFELNNPNTTEMYGFEAQVEAVFGDLAIDAGLGLLNSELGEFYAVDPRRPSFAPCDPATGPETANCNNLEGRDQTYAPELTFNIAIRYTFGLANGDKVTPLVNYAHVAEQWATLFQDESRGDLIEARDIVNAQIAWSHNDWVATLYCNNLTDQHYVGAINSGLRFAGPPRQYGLRVLKSF